MSATRGIDFTRLSLREALDFAIAIEEEARDRYYEFADQLLVHHTAEAAAFFARMSHIEEIHRSTLTTRRERLFPGEPAGTMRASIFDVEAPEYDEARAFMSVREALETALAAEEKAHAFFAGALPQLRHRRGPGALRRAPRRGGRAPAAGRGRAGQAARRTLCAGAAYSDDPVAQ